MKEVYKIMYHIAEDLDDQITVNELCDLLEERGYSYKKNKRGIFKAISSGYDAYVKKDGNDERATTLWNAYLTNNGEHLVR